MVISSISDVAISGDSTILSVDDDKKVRLHAALVSVEGDMTGTVILKCGASIIGKLRNPVVGGNHLLFIGTSNYYFQGNQGEDIIVTGDGATTNFNVTLIYKIQN